MKKNRSLTYITLHLMVALLSISGVFSKKASGYRFLSPHFILYYGFSIMILIIYAFGWQQILKRIRLTTAYSARSASVIWGLVWGIIVFHEKLAPVKLIGIALVFAGLILYFRDDREKGDEP